ncbi:hypothetical protein F2Q70_00029413 [Brassica cretica]|uniref:Uncharacterized protein n=1 Tax=Brassica cretica TaxID=69181 RepID=A0A8S9FBV6_BRACR|nr:hypothetical protein F2Q70_00029413 [Brassica cretica]
MDKGGDLHNFPSQVHQNLSCSFRKSTAHLTAQNQPLKTFPSEFSCSMKKKAEAMACLSSSLLSVLMERLIGNRDLKKGEVFELEKQEGGHELKEKEVGEDPDSQIQHKPWPVPLEMKATLSMWLQVLRLHDPRVLGCYSRREANRLGSMVEDEEAMSKAASSVEVVGVRLKHPYVVPATRW